MLSLFNCIFGRFKQLRAMACLVVARCLRLHVAYGAGLRRVACRASRHAPLHHALWLVYFVYICCMAMPCGPFCVPIRAVSPCQTARIGIQPRPFRGAVSAAVQMVGCQDVGLPHALCETCLHILHRRCLAVGRAAGLRAQPSSPWRRGCPARA